MKRGGRFLGVFTAIVLVTSCGEQPPEAVEIDEVKELVSQVNELSGAIQAVAYNFEFYGTEDIEEFIPLITGSAKLMSGGGPDCEYLLWIDLDGVPGEEEEYRIPPMTMAVDGESAYQLNSVDKTFQYGLLSEDAYDLIIVPLTGILDEYVIPDPFMDEVIGCSRVLEGTQEIGGVVCDIVYVVYADSITEARWFFGQEDHHPRRVERFVNMEGITGAQVLEISNLDTDPGFGLENFILEIPDESYTSVHYVPETIEEEQPE